VLVEQAAQPLLQLLQQDLPLLVELVLDDLQLRQVPELPNHFARISKNCFRIFTIIVSMSRLCSFSIFT